MCRRGASMRCRFAVSDGERIVDAITVVEDGIEKLNKALAELKSVDAEKAFTESYSFRTAGVSLALIGSAALLVQLTALETYEYLELSVRANRGKK